MSRFVQLLPALVLVFVTACTPRFSKLFSSSCSAPCWYKVTPGQTTKNELLTLVPTFPYYQEQGISWHDATHRYSERVPESATAQFSMSIENDKAYIIVNIKDNLVTNIGFYSGLGFLQQHYVLGLNLSDIVEKYGEPSNMFIREDCGGDVSCRNLVIVYPDQGILAAVESGDSYENFRVLRTLPVVAMVYFQPPDYKGSLSSLPYSSSDNCDPYMLNWQGFTTINAEGKVNGCP